MATATKKKPPKKKKPPDKKIVERFSSELKNPLDVDIKNLLLDGETVDEDVHESILQANLERTMQGASTLTLVIHDPKRQLLESEFLKPRGTKDGVIPDIHAELDGLHFSLVKLAKSGKDFTLTFEDQEVAWLRKYTTPRKAARNRVTRAQFVQLLVQEVKEGRINFYCPELKERQPVARGAPATRQTPQAAVTTRAHGFAPGARITVKGAGASKEQKDTISRVLAQGEREKAPEPVLICAVMTITVENTASNGAGGDPGTGSAGAFQQRPETGWGSPSDVRNLEKAAHRFYSDAPTARGGAIGVFKRNPGMSLNDICQEVQASGTPSAYGVWKSEATRTVKAWLGAGGATAADTPAAALATTAQYEFSRGQGSAREDSWACIQRLAGEVGWHAFMVDGTLFYVSDNRLISSEPIMLLDEGMPGVDWIDFDLDIGKPVQGMTITCRADRWEAPPGSVIQTQNLGPGNGRWLVQRMARSLFTPNTTIELRRTVPKGQEPAEAQTEGGTGPQRVVQAGRVTTGGGYVLPFKRAGGGRTDNGVDFEIPVGSPLLAVGDGKIVNTEGEFPGGSIVLLLDRKPPGLPTAYIYYGHLSEGGKRVRSGQRVKAGDIVARTSSRPPGAEDMPGHCEIGCARGSSGVIYTGGHADGATAWGLDFRRWMHSLNQGFRD